MSDQEELSSEEDVPLTFIDLIKKRCETSSIYDLIDHEHPFPAGVTSEDILNYKPAENKGLRPYIKIRLMKDYSSKDKKNRMKPAIEIGIEMEF